MPTDLPKEVNDAIDVLWKYSTDACISGRTKEECEAEGYECKGTSAYYVTFVMDRIDDPTPTSPPIKYKCSDCVFEGVHVRICHEYPGTGSDCKNFDKG